MAFYYFSLIEIIIYLYYIIYFSRNCHVWKLCFIGCIQNMPFQDDDLSLDWGNWTFLERSESTNFDFENEPLAKNERTVKALHFDNFLNLSGCRNDGSSYQCPIQVDKVPLHHSPIRQDYLNSTSSVVLNDEQVADHERSIERKEVFIYCFLEVLVRKTIQKNTHNTS